MGSQFDSQTDNASLQSCKRVDKYMPKPEKWFEVKNKTVKVRKLSYVENIWTAIAKMRLKRHWDQIFEF